MPVIAAVSCNNFQRDFGFQLKRLDPHLFSLLCLQHGLCCRQTTLCKCSGNIELQQTTPSSNFAHLPGGLLINVIANTLPNQARRHDPRQSSLSVYVRLSGVRASDRQPGWNGLPVLFSWGDIAGIPRRLSHPLPLAWASKFEIPSIDWFSVQNTKNSRISTGSHLKPKLGKCPTIPTPDALKLQLHRKILGKETRAKVYPVGKNWMQLHQKVQSAPLSCFASCLQGLRCAKTSSSLAGKSFW